MRHAVLGVGAIGGLIGTALGFLGEEVVLIVRPEKLANYPQQLSLEQPDRIITGPAHAVSRLTGEADVLWIATKAYQLQGALESVEAPPKIVVPLLNGVDHIAVLRARFGHDHVVPATIAVGADRLAEGRFAAPSIIRLSVAESGKPLLGSLLTALQEHVGFICHFVSNEQTLLWTKLCFLAPFALVTSASGKNKDNIFADPEWKATLQSAIAEAIATAKADGAEVQVSTIQTMLDTSPGTMRSSMLKDLIAGRKLELDGIGGPIVRRGEKYGIAVPTTKKLMAMIESRITAHNASASSRTSSP